MKRLLMLLVLFLIFPYKVFAYGDLRCYGSLNSNDETTLQPGNIITINMGVSGYSDTQHISDAVFSFTYNPNVFDVVKNASNDSYLTIFNKWDTYKNNITEIDENTNKVSFNIGTSNSNNYFFDTSDSIIFAKVQLKVKDTATNGYSYVSVFDESSYYTSFVLDDNKVPDQIYDVNCSSQRITISIKLPEKDKDTSLKSLKITNATLDQLFSSNSTRYTATVPYSTEKVYIAGTCNGYKCTIKGNGTRTLKVGVNNYTLTVTAEDGSTREYTVSITREEKEKSYAYLSSLEVEGHSISPSFKSTTLVYTLNISPDTNTLKIYAICESKTCNIKGDGIVTLKDDTTTISVVVTTDDDSKTYTFNIIRADVIDDISNPIESSGGGGFITFLWIVFIIMIIGALYYFYKKSGININISKTNNKKNDNNIDNNWRYK
jgi:hypothetical protein